MGSPLETIRYRALVVHQIEITLKNKISIYGNKVQMGAEARYGGDTRYGEQIIAKIRTPHPGVTEGRLPRPGGSRYPGSAKNRLVKTV